MWCGNLKKLAIFTPASELFGEEDAQRAIAWVDELLELFEELIRGSEG